MSPFKIVLVGAGLTIEMDSLELALEEEINTIIVVVPYVSYLERI